jgi:hypothetical protein
LVKYATDLDFSKVTLFINIDPVPKKKVVPEIVKIAKTFFGKVVINRPATPNFPAGVKWVWQEASKHKFSFVLNVQDDWGFVSPFKLQDILTVFARAPKLDQVILRRKPYYPRAKMILAPSVIRMRVIKEVAINLKTDRNPEIQLRKGRALEKAPRTLVLPRKAGVFITKDIGRVWARKNKLTKGHKSKFLTWAPVDTENKVLAAGPFFGELGWECFSWQPLVRNAWRKGNYTRCIVYTCRKSSGLLYPFAEMRSIAIPGGNQPSCNHLLHTGGLKAIRDVEKRLKESLGRELTNFRQLFTSKLAVHEPYYSRGMHTKVLPNDPFKYKIDEPGPVITVCARDKRCGGKAATRNWPFEKWEKLLTELREMGTVVVVGKVAKGGGWPHNMEGIIDLTNGTSINDCIDIFHQSDLVLGGSTGTLHLASRCGIDHLVWGTKRNKKRFLETNWHDANCHVVTGGHNPSVSKIVDVVKNWFNEGDLTYE